MQSGTVAEVVIILAVLVSVSLMTFNKLISSDDYFKLLTTLLGYVFGRIINSKQGKEQL